VLKFDKVTKSFKGPENRIIALRNIDFSLSAGEFLAIQGPSGCGKTTLLMTAAGLLRPDEGTVRIDDQNPYLLDADKRSEFRARTIGFVFQQFHLIPYLTVKENIATPLLAGTKLADYTHRVKELVDRFGLQKRINHLPAQLSTGEKQRTACARAVLNSPRIIMADEPTGNLDQDNAEIIYSFFKEYAAEGGSVLLVTHDMDAGSFATRLLHMNEGEIISSTV
jgi:putative ABC transport system ATP-binding protein